MHIYRALNECDMVINPMENGLFSKNTINQGLEEACYRYIGLFDINFTSVSDYKEAFKLVRNKFIPYEISNIKNMALIKQKRELEIIKNVITDIDNPDNNYKFYSLFEKINTHLRKGSNVDTDWISFSTDLSSTFRYYLKQEYHKLVIVDSNINLLLDGDLISLNLSNSEEIGKLKDLLIKKVGDTYYYTNLKSVGFNYANSSNEIIYRNYIPKEKIIAVLDAFEVDLLLNNAYNLDILKTKSYKIYWLNIIKYTLKKYLEENNKELVNLYNDIYLNNKSLENIAHKNQESYYDLKDKKRYILSKLNDIEVNLPYIPKFKEKIKLPEDYI